MKIQFQDLATAVLNLASTEKAVTAFASARVRSYAQWTEEEKAKFRSLVSASDDAKFAIAILAERLSAEPVPAAPEAEQAAQ